jgi:hypothetical protein
MKIDFEGFAKPGANATQKTAATEQPVAAEQPTTTAAVTSTVPVELSAAEQLERAQRPLKRDVAAMAPELLTPRGIAIQTDAVKRTFEEAVATKNEQLKTVAAEVLSEKSQGKTDEMKSAVAEAVNAVLDKFLPVLERISGPRPAELAAAAKDAAAQERSKREWDRERLQMKQTKLAQRQAMARCSHTDGNGHPRWQISHNQPSHLPIAWCSQCQLRVEPKRYLCLPPSITDESSAAEYIKLLVAEGEISGGTPFFDATGGYILANEHPLYYLIRALEAQASMGVI